MDGVNRGRGSFNSSEYNESDFSDDLHAEEEDRHRPSRVHHKLIRDLNN